MPRDSVLEIVAYGAWNGGTLVDNSQYEQRGMVFKGGIAVTNATIEKRIGVRTRIAAGTDERIGVTAFKDLLDTSGIDPSRIKLLIGATNVGDDKYDPGPLIRYPFRIVKAHCPDAFVLDMYAGCPGFNVAVELAFMLSLSGVLRKDDISVVVGAENLHRAKAFPKHDTATIIFGDDAIAAALQTKTSAAPVGQYSTRQQTEFTISHDPVTETACKIKTLIANTRLDGIIIDNQLGKIERRVPATAARVQQALLEQLFPEETSNGIFKRFKEAIAFYDQNVKSFAFDIMSLGAGTEQVNQIARAYVESGKYQNVVCVYMASDLNCTITLHSGSNFAFKRPQKGIVDTLTRTHGCFADYIQAIPTDNDVFGDMDGKGVFLYATRGANTHLTDLLTPNNMTLADVELLIEHQANFAMIPLTLEQVIGNGQSDLKAIVADIVANKMITNIHLRGNCSVVCMQRLPYDLQRGALKPDKIQGYAVNCNLEALKNAKRILNDSVGAGMTRSSFLQIN
jgi:3-oxoacyl-[acyl-carrier-protein] synthase III